MVYADNDAIKQSDQILKAIQSPAGTRPDAILLNLWAQRRCRRWRARRRVLKLDGWY